MRLNAHKGWRKKGRAKPDASVFLTSIDAFSYYPVKPLGGLATPSSMKGKKEVPVSLNFPDASVFLTSIDAFSYYPVNPLGGLATPSSMKGKKEVPVSLNFPFIDEGVDAEGRRGSRKNGSPPYGVRRQAAALHTTTRGLSKWQRPTLVCTALSGLNPIAHSTWTLDIPCWILDIPYAT